MYHELARGNRVAPASWLTWSTHASSASTVASIASSPCAPRYDRQSAIQSTCCSMAMTMLLRTDGLPGPVRMKRLGKPAVAIPRYVRGPADHLSRSGRSPRPRSEEHTSEHQ